MRLHPPKAHHIALNHYLKEIEAKVERRQ